MFRRNISELMDQNWFDLIDRHLKRGNEIYAWQEFIRASNHPKSVCSRDMLPQLVNLIFASMVRRFRWEEVPETFSVEIDEHRLTHQTSIAMENIWSRLLIEVKSDPYAPYLLTPECERARLLEEHFEDHQICRRRHHRRHLRGEFPGSTRHHLSSP